MKARMKRILSVVLALAMTAALVSMSAFALGTTDFALDAAAEVTVDGTADQTVNVVFSANSAMSVIALQGTFSTTETEGTGYLTLSDYVSPVALTGTNYFDTPSGATVYVDSALEGFAVEAGGNVMTAVYTVDKDTPTGTYTVEFSVVIVQDYDFNTVKNQVYTATIDVKNEPFVAEGYTVALSSGTGSVETGETVDVYLDVTNSDSAVTAFNAVDLTLTYDSANFTFDSANSTLNGFSVETEAGTLHIQGYGPAVTLGDGHELTLKFTAGGTAASDLAFALTSAKVDQAANADQNIPDAAITGSPVTVSITEPAVPTYTVTFVGGEDATGTAPTQEDTAEGGIFTLPENSFAKTGYTFTGWSDGANTYQAGDTYTMPAANVTFTAQWKLNDPAVSVDELSTAYLNGYTLIKATIADANGNVPTYDGNAMYQITNVSGQTTYDETAYYYIVKTTEYDSAKVGYAAVTAETIAKDGDANGTGVIDINDAQFIYNLYNADTITVPYTPTVAQLLASDVNGDGAVDTLDCAAVVPLIP